MKLIYIMVLFSSMLFGMHKQIILGSYSIQENAFNALEVVKNQLDDDEKLKVIMGENSAQVMTTVISGYTVVSVNVFDSYSGLLPAMKVFKTYYGDAYVLKYPTQGFVEIENMKEVERKAHEEMQAQEELQAQEEALKEQNLAEEIAEEERLQSEAQAQILEEIPAPAVAKTTKSINELMSNTNKEEISGMTMQNYYLLGGLALLVLLIGGFIIYQKISKDDEEK